MIKWKVGVYLRLSSDDGDKMESNSITNQRKLIDLFLKKEKDLIIKDYYIDDGYSGTDFNRPDFQRLIADVKNKRINAIIVKDLSRLGRNYIEVGNYIEEIFPLYNVRFIAINDNVDSYKDPKSVNNIIVPFKNLMNDEYARDISNKVRSVLNTKKSNGEFIGSVAPYGYLRDPKDKHKFIIDNEASKIVKKIFNMALRGKSKKEIVEELNKCGVLTPALYQIKKSIYNHRITDKMYQWNTRTLDRILQNQSYTGDLIQGSRRIISHKVHKVMKVNSKEWVIVPNHHTPLISKAEFNQVQDVIYNRDIRVMKNNKYDIFAGHIKCHECGNSLTIRKAKNHEYYYCTTYLKDKECSKHSNNKKNIENIVLTIINNQIDLIVDIDEKINKIMENEFVNYDFEVMKARIKEITENIEKYNLLKDSVRKDFISEYICKDEFEEYNKEYNLMLNKLVKEKNNSEKELEKINFKSHKNKEWIDKFKANQNLEKLTKKVVDELIEDIFVYEDGNIRITFKYKDEYFEAIDFLKKHNCDIIEKNCVKLNEIA